MKIKELNRSRLDTCGKICHVPFEQLKRKSIMKISIGNVFTGNDAERENLFQNTTYGQANIAWARWMSKTQLNSSIMLQEGHNIDAQLKQ